VLEKIVLPLALIVLMLGLGMTLKRGDFLRVARRKRVVAAALLSIFLVMPAVAWGIGGLFDLAAPLSMGLILLAACPGGMLSNMMTHSARGDVVLSVTLTVASTLIYGLAAPLAVTLFISHPGDKMESTVLAMLRMVAEVLGVVVVPMLAGMALRSRNPLLCAAVEAPLRWAAAALVVAVFIRLGYLQIASFEAAGLRMVGAVVSLNLIGWVMAGAIGVGFRLSRSEFIAISMEHSIRQEGTGVFVAVSIVGNPYIAVPLIINSAVGFLLSVVMNGTTALLAGRRLGGPLV